MWPMDRGPSWTGSGEDLLGRGRARGECFPFPFPSLPKGWRRKRFWVTAPAGVCRCHRPVAPRFRRPRRRGGIRLPAHARRVVRGSSSGEHQHGRYQRHRRPPPVLRGLDRRRDLQFLLFDFLVPWRRSRLSACAQPHGLLQPARLPPALTLSAEALILRLRQFGWRYGLRRP